MGKLKYLILHCTATPQGMAVSPDTIRKWHTSPVSAGGRGWKRVGYSDMVLLDGTLVNLTPYDADDDVEAWEITNGVMGKNDISRHIVYVGGLSRQKNPMDTRTPQQLLAMTNYVKQVVQAHPTILIGGHNQFDNKACPSFNVPEWLQSIGINEKNIYKP